MNSALLLPQNRKIMHIDMNSFFASVEQQANPFLRNRALGVSSGLTGHNAILAASYEAKAKGIGTGTRNSEARVLDPSIQIVKISHNKYYDYSVKLLEIFRRYSPTVEAYSVDEAFLDFSHTSYTFEELKSVAERIKNTIYDELGECIRCSIGISTNKLLAKVGSDWKKPNGLTYIPFEERSKYLDSMEIGDIWGYGWSVTKKLKSFGIVNTEQVRQMKNDFAERLFGSYYIKLKMIANGEDYSPVQNTELSIHIPKSMQHAHVIGKPETNIVEMLRLIRKLSEKLANRLRGYGLSTKFIYFSMRDELTEGIHYVQKLEIATQNGKEIYDICKKRII